MTYEDFLNLSIGVKLINQQGIIYKVAWKRNKDKWALTKGNGVFCDFIHKNNYNNFDLIK